MNIRTARPLPATIYVVVVHALALAAVLYSLICLVPDYEHTLRRQRVQLPVLTEQVIALSHVARAYWLFFSPLFLACDGAIIYFLRKRCVSRAPSTLWAALVMLILLACAVATVLGLRIALALLKSRIAMG